MPSPKVSDPELPVTEQQLMHRLYRRVGPMQRQLSCDRDPSSELTKQHAFHFHCISRWLKTRHGKLASCSDV